MIASTKFLSATAFLFTLGALPSKAFLCFTNNQELKDAVAAYAYNSSVGTDVATTYGHPIGNWCVDFVTDFSNVFSGSSLNEPLTNWNTGMATTMSYMFSFSSFNQDLSHFDVRNVADLQGMFYRSSFNQDISMWELQSARFMASMFAGYDGYTQTAFRKDLCQWGLYAPNFIDVAGMFAFSDCEDETDPDLGASPPGPFCFPCITPPYPASTNSTVAPYTTDEASCVQPPDPVGECAKQLWQQCGTCHLRLHAQCLSNVVNACCRGNQPLQQFTQQVRKTMRQSHCQTNNN